MIRHIVGIYKRYEEIINYLIVGGMTTVVSLGVYYGLVSTVLNPENGFFLQAANIASWIAAVSFAYVTNRKYVFKSADRHILREVSAFFSSRIGTLVIDMGIMFVGVTILNCNDKIMKLIVQIAVTILNYLFSKLFVFKKK